VTLEKSRRGKMSGEDGRRGQRKMALEMRMSGEDGSQEGSRREDGTEDERRKEVSILACL
jgi:hypothetical protein